MDLSIDDTKFIKNRKKFLYLTYDEQNDLFEFYNDEILNLLHRNAGFNDLEKLKLLTKMRNFLKKKIIDEYGEIGIVSLKEIENYD